MVATPLESARTTAGRTRATQAAGSKLGRMLTSRRASSQVATSATALDGMIAASSGRSPAPDRTRATVSTTRVACRASASPLANAVAVTIGGQPSAVDFAGVIAAGLVQINVHVPPSINNGDAGVVATVGGVSTQTTANMISIHN